MTPSSPLAYLPEYSGTRPPLKLAIAAFFLDGAVHGVHETTAAMKAVYPSEEYVNNSSVEGCLQSLRAVGIVRAEDPPAQKGAGSAVEDLWFALTATGHKKVKKNLGLPL